MKYYSSKHYIHSEARSPLALMLVNVWFSWKLSIKSLSKLFYIFYLILNRIFVNYTQSHHSQHITQVSMQKNAFIPRGSVQNQHFKQENSWIFNDKIRNRWWERISILIRIKQSPEWPPCYCLCLILIKYDRTVDQKYFSL